MQSQNSRKKLIVNPKLQYRMMGILISSGVTVCIIFLIGLYCFMDQIFTFLEKTEGISVESKIELFASWNNMLYVMIVLVGFSIFTLWLWAKSFTNKIVGPIFNINRVLDAYNAGDLSARIKLRESDYFSELSEKINCALDKSDKLKV